MDEANQNKNSGFDLWLADRERKRIRRQEIQARGGRLKSKALNKVSKKQSQKLKQYKAARAEHYSIESNRRCKLCGCVDNLSIHHVAKRGVNLNKQDKFITLCLASDYCRNAFPELNHNHSGGCHGFVEANKAWARANGYLE